MDASQFLKDYGGHLLGLIGIVQLWAIAAWKRFIRRGTLSVYQTTNIEIGFSGFGPTVTLLGTLRAEDKDIFVHRMKLRVIRVSDRAEHTFTWRAFRPNVLALSGAQQSLEIARLVTGVPNGYREQLHHALCWDRGVSRGAELRAGRRGRDDLPEGRRIAERLRDRNPYWVRTCAFRSSSQLRVTWS